MKKILLSCFILTFITLVGIGTVSASSSNKTIKGNIARAYTLLFLTQKDAEWKPIKGGSWGVVGYKEDNYIFVGYKLKSGEHYTLINYIDPAPGVITCLSSGRANERGEIVLMGRADIKGLGKVWLTTTSDLNCAKGIMQGFDRTKYLFENDLI